MRILHTSDWHLGKQLEGHSRLEEQRQFLDELLCICTEESVDIVLVAGDVYDSSNPPAAAEQLFYKYMNLLADGGRRPVIVIAGNHDNPDRLTASAPFVHEQGLILLGLPNHRVQTGDYGFFAITESEPGYFMLRLRRDGEDLPPVRIAALPYPSEKRLNELYEDSVDYTDKIAELFGAPAAHFSKDSINIAISHLFMLGGEPSGSEQNRSLGGSLLASRSALPDADYVALGHIHRPQRVSGTAKAYYSGSPIQYHIDEHNQAKLVYLVDLMPGSTEVTKRYLTNYRPIKICNAYSSEEAIELCQLYQNENCWIYLNIHTPSFVSQDTIKKIRELKEGILQINIITPEQEIQYEEEAIQSKTPAQQFREFYMHERQVSECSDELVDLFLSLLEGGR